MNFLSYAGMNVLVYMLKVAANDDTIIAGYCPHFESQSTAIVRLTINECGGTDEKPKMFRTCQDNLLEEFSKKDLPKSKFPSIYGLGSIRASGSAQFCTHQCGQWLVNFLKDKQKEGPVIVVDLRMEAHGFVNGQAVSWYCPGNWERLGQDAGFFEHDELLRLWAIRRLESIALYKRKEKLEIAESLNQMLKVQNVVSEAEFIRSHGLGYLRIYVPDHCRPFDHDVDRYVQLIDSLPPGAWLHLHCKGGAGRTTTFLAMIDMVKNATTVSFDNILYRQYVLGKSHLGDLRLYSNSYKTEPARERLKFLQEFYAFCQYRQKLNKNIGWIQYKTTTQGSHYSTIAERIKSMAMRLSYGTRWAFRSLSTILAREEYL